VWPLARRSFDSVRLGGAVVDLNGKTICELWDWLFRGSEMFPLIRAGLQARFPGARFVGYDAFGSTHRGGEVLTELPGFLREQGADLVISGIGA
jgi:hypothetical protein